MITLTSALFAVILILIILHLSIHYNRVGRLINKIGGPPRFPVLGTLPYLLGSPEVLWRNLQRFGHEYYPIVRIWVLHWPVVFIRHPDDAEILLSSPNHIEKSLFYDFLHPWLKTGLLTSTGEKWRKRRRILTPAFHFNVLQEFVDVFVETSEQLVNSLKHEDGPMVRDLVPIIAKHTLNAICESAMGTTLDENDPLQQKYRNGVKHMGNLTYFRSTRPWLKNDWIFSLTEEGRQQKASLEILHGFTSKIINERKEYHVATGGKYLINDSEMRYDTVSTTDDLQVKKKRLAMLDLLISVQTAHQGIDDLGIREEVDTFIFEGHDTTTMGMCFALLLLAEHKEIQTRGISLHSNDANFRVINSGMARAIQEKERARQEIDGVFKEFNGRLGMSAVANLPYLDRCIKESLRIFPAVPVISRRMHEDLQLKNYLLPKGTIVNCDIYNLHRDANFWPDPLVYDPDRFLPDRIRNRHPFSYIPFSAGPRNCIGQKLAMLELKTVVAYLLHNFYLEPIIECRNLPMLPDLVLKAAVPLDVKFIPIRR